MFKKISFLLLIPAMLLLMVAISFSTDSAGAQSSSSVPRKGFSSVLNPGYIEVEAYIHPALGDWIYTWGAYNPSGPYPQDRQLVPMIASRNVVANASTVSSIDSKTDATNTPHDYWTVFNECERRGQCLQACFNDPTITDCSLQNWAREQAIFYHNEVLTRAYGSSGNPNSPSSNASDANAKLIVGGSATSKISGTSIDGLDWMTHFVEEYELLYGAPPPRSGWHFHVYPSVDNGYLDLDGFKDELAKVRTWLEENGSPEDEVWITEMGCLSPDFCPQADVESAMVDITNYLNNDGRWVDRYAWFVARTPGPPICTNCGYTPTTFLLSETDPNVLTSLGQAYAAVQAAPSTSLYPELNQILWRNNQGWLRTVPVVDGSIKWSYAEDWEPFLNATDLNGSGNVQAFSSYVLGNNLKQGIWRGDEGWSRTVPIVNGVPDWNNASSWGGPWTHNNLPGSGTGQALTGYILGSTLKQGIWRGNEGWSRTVPIVNGVPDWGNASNWGGPWTHNNLPGSGTGQALTSYVLGNNLKQGIWRGNEGWSRTIPIVGGVPDWGNASNWGGPWSLGNQPGYGDMQALESFYLPKP